MKGSTSRVDVALGEADRGVQKRLQIHTEPGEVQRGIHRGAIFKEKKKGGGRKRFEVVMTENFPHLMKNINVHSQEAQQTPSSINSNRSIPRHMILKLPKKKKKERNFFNIASKTKIHHRGKEAILR